MSPAVIFLILLLAALAGGFHDWGRGPFYGAGWYGGGWFGLLLVLIVLLILTHRLKGL